jgi:hypothetical protein
MDGTEEEQVYFHMWKSIPSVSLGSDAKYNDDIALLS